ncbi:hypothetical protein LCGC14_1853410 [marine sediment metagenome]|uniref:DUF2158 domain-containing protein n=1 Tax=marine sediment metagenome TaxID=412755 RepID=A0A0F9G9L3_9ZZZZ
MKVGEVVEVKAKDGPKMTVNKILKSNTVECVWFEGLDLHRGAFAVDALEEVVNPV